MQARGGFAASYPMMMENSPMWRFNFFWHGIKTASFLSYTAYSSLNRQPENAPIHIRAMLFHAYTRLFRLPLLIHYHYRYKHPRQPENK